MRTSLEEFADRIEVVGALASAEAFLGTCDELRVDVALIDLGLPGLSGMELIRQLADSRPRLRSLAWTVFQDEQTVSDTIRAGAYGFLLKDEPTTRLVQAIEEAAAGEHPISSRIAGFLFAHVRLGLPLVRLTARETELAAALAEGLSYAECGQRMGISVGTVQDHVKRLYPKLNVSTKSGVRAWVGRHLKAP